MVFAAWLTQRGYRIASMADLERLYEQPYTDTALKTIAALPHPTVQKFAVITVAIVGASRRFLAQITRHQNEVKFMSASLQYSDYTPGAPNLPCVVQREAEISTFQSKPFYVSE